MQTIPKNIRVTRDHWHLEPARKGRLNQNQFDRLANIDLTQSNDPQGELLKRIKSRFGLTPSDIRKLTDEQFQNLIEIATEEREQEFSALVDEIKGATLYQGSPYPDERWDKEKDQFDYDPIPSPRELIEQDQLRKEEAQKIAALLWEQQWQDSSYRENTHHFDEEDPQPMRYPSGGNSRRPIMSPSSPRHRITTATATEWPRPQFKIVTD